MEKQEDRNCLPCRLIGGGGVTLAGIYVASQVPKQAKFPAKAVVSAFACGILYTGVARLLDLPPFTQKDGHQ